MEFAAPPPPAWAVVCAWAVPLAILPSALWRVSLLFRRGHPLLAIADGGWYLLLLSCGSLGLGLLTLGLVQRWGIVFPRWLPGIGGRPVPARGATLTAGLGAFAVIAVELYGAVNARFDLVRPEPLIRIGPLVPQVEPNAAVAALYLPLTAWGPLLIAVALNYYRRRTVPQHS